MDGRGAAVVGLNPGRSKKDEQRYYLGNQCTYASAMSWFHDKHLQCKYHKHLRRLVDALGLIGPTLWTELAKCENDPEFEELPLQTLRTCSGVFLQRELKCLPAGWPLLGVGREAYKALAYLFPKRTVIGVPHPTGSRGQFFALFENGSLCEVCRHSGKKGDLWQW
jgi:hypothetical protein